MPVYKDNSRLKNGRPTWYYKVSYTDTFGEHHDKKSKRFESKKDAERAEAEFRLALKSPPSSNITIGQLIDEYSVMKKDQVRLSTWQHEQNQLNHVRSSLGDIKVEKLTKALYKAFLDDLTSKGLSARYKNKTVETFKRVLHFGLRMHSVTSSVPELFEPFKTTGTKNTMKLDFITYNEFTQFIQGVDDPVYEALFTLLFFEGLRIGEANALTWNDIDFDRGKLSVNKTVDTKLKTESGSYLVQPPKTSSGYRNIPFNELVADRLKMLQSRQMKMKGYSDDWYVFGGKKPISQSQISKKKKEYFAKVPEVKEIRVHGFRHSCACYMINVKNVNPTVLAAYLGHSSTKETLDTYSSFYESVMDDIWR